VTASAALAATGSVVLGAAAARWRARRQRRYVRLRLVPYRSDRASAAAVAAALNAWHGLLYVPAPRRLLAGQPSLALEIHLHIRDGGAPLAWLGVSCPRGRERQVEAALRGAYPNASLWPVTARLGRPPAIALLRRQRPVQAAPTGTIGPFDPDRPPVERVLRAMAASGGPALVQIALTPAPRLLESALAAPPAAEESGGPRRAHGGPLFAADIRVVAPSRGWCRAVAAELGAGTEAVRLIARRAIGVGRRRIDRGEARPLPLPGRDTYTAEELAPLWQLPSVGFMALPIARRATPLAPAPPGILRAAAGGGVLRDDHGPLSIHVQLRRQNTAVVGAVGQGKTSCLVASIREDLQREDCAVIVLDPKGDAADAALSAVPDSRNCTLLDMALPTCGFNPLAVDAPADAIADYVVAALRQLFADGEVRGSSDRYLRNAVIAVLACDRAATLWDVARLLAVGAEGQAMREETARALTAQPQYAEVATFLADELPVQLAEARSTTTAKLDAPANKLARVLNSPSVKRVLLNDSLLIDLDRLIERREVLVVRGALGVVGPGNVSVLMQLLVGMLDAALARRQDRAAGDARGAVALKIDEAPLVVNAAFAQTLALKRSAGLETVACWQTDAQWSPELREQLDALFAHRILFATASADDARAAAGLLMAEFSDQLRAGDESPAARLATPDVRLHLPRHTAIASWTTPAGRERPFIARTLPLSVDRVQIERHAARQRARGGRELTQVAPPPRFAEGPAPSAQLGSTVEQSRAPVATGAQGEPAPESFAELEALDYARRARWLPVPAGESERRPLDDRDLELLRWIAAARCALSTQIHRRFNPGRALTTTQRRLKRLADAGLIARFQSHRDDGGGVPLCCTITASGHEALGSPKRRAPERSDEWTLARLRADIHTVAWLLALEAHAGEALLSVLGPGRARIACEGAGVRGPRELPLSPGVHARDFMDATTGREVDRFAAIAPEAVAELRLEHDGSPVATDLLLIGDGPNIGELLVRCDHLLTGWWRLVPRYARRGAPPIVAVICDGADRAAALAASADAILLACLARIGIAPERWEFGGRAGVGFVAERDLHEGRLDCWRVPPLPAWLRGEQHAEPLRGAVARLAADGDRPAGGLARWY
jgi:hypothetical protein